MYSVIPLSTSLLVLVDETNSLDNMARHAVDWIHSHQSRVTHQRQAGYTKDCVEHVRHVARPVGDTAGLVILPRSKTKMLDSVSTRSRNTLGQVF